MEKQLKDAKRETEDTRLLVKTGELSQDELKKRMAELSRKWKQAEDDMKKDRDEIDTMKSQLTEKEEQVSKMMSQMQKEQNYFKDLIK